MAQANAPYGIEPTTGLPYSDKQKMVAGLLQLLLPIVGICGVGRLYTGHVALGVLQLLFGWLTCGIWPLVDGILILTGKVTDAQGRPLRD
jgi:TM2 domain-containing membrane protein YozV